MELTEQERESIERFITSKEAAGDLAGISGAEIDDLRSTLQYRTLYARIEAEFHEGKRTDWAPNADWGVLRLGLDREEWKEIEASAVKARTHWRSAVTGLSDKETWLEDFLHKYAEAGEFEGNEKLGGVFGLLPPTPKLFRKFEAAMQTGRIRKKGDPTKQFMPDNNISTDHACAFLVAFWDRGLPFKSGTLPPLAFWTYRAIAELFEAFGLAGNWTDDKKFTRVRDRVERYGLQLSRTTLVDGFEQKFDGCISDGFDRKIKGFIPELKVRETSRRVKRQAEG